MWVHKNTDKNDFRESVIKVIKTFICLQLLIYEKNMHLKFVTVVCSTHVRLHSKPTPELIYMYITIPEELEELCSLVSISAVRECCTTIWPLNGEKSLNGKSFKVGQANLSV